ncbi:MAG: VWA domain-containing protein [Chloroflexi bacterium]|nr:VWA domain-containing protein [Anaerolineaceae bacterium]NMB89789.1 VWA domain-containing protein [Chloroflexota bacterium]
MNLLWPVSLFLLGLVPLLVGAYVWSLRRRRAAVRYSSLVLIREALPPQSQLRRHLPFALFVLALASLVFALGRPVVTTLVPAGRATIILAIDVSRSMLQDDIQPNRLLAAEDAVQSFIEHRTSNTQIGIVAFSGFAQQVLSPTIDQEELQAVVESLTTGRGTAIGSGILEGLDAIADVNNRVSQTSSGVQPTPVPDGEYVPDIIVVLTDGVFTTGPHPLEAAQQAADRGVRVYTIGFGTENGSFSFGGWGGFRRGIDEEMLKQVAATTGGEYYAATSASELQDVFESLPSYLITREETTEISVAFAAAGALLVAAAIFLSLLWRPLP